MYLQANLQYLKEYNPMLLSEINQISTDELEWINAQGTSVIKLVDDNGNEFYSASIYDPDHEADIFLKDVNMDNTGFLVMGLNSSALIKKLLEQKTETAWLFIIEKDLRIIKYFLENFDLSLYLEGKLQRIVFFYGEEGQIRTNLQHFLYSLVGYYFLQVELLRTFPTYRKDRELYNNIYQFIGDTIRNHVFNLGNDLEDTLMGIRNEFKNLKYTLTNPKLKDLKNRFKDVPMISVASGPSLDKQLPLLKKVQGKAIIISAESALKVLLKNGITPDIVCILERGMNSYELSVKDVDIPQQTALFGLTIIEPKIYEAWPKYIIPNFKQNLSYSHFMNEALGDFGEYYSGNSVAHMNYMLAHYLGGSPIILIGQDLAYSEEGKTHSKDTIYNLEDQNLEIEDNIRNQIKASLEDNQSFHNKEVWLDGYYGGKVKSRELWRQFLYWMEHLINISRVPTINATEGGVNIQGAKNLPFEEVISTYCQQDVSSIGETIDTLEVLSQEEIEDKLWNLQEKINTEILHELEGLLEYAQENLDYLQQFLSDYENNKMQLFSLKADKILRNNERLIRLIMAKSYIHFYFRPLIGNLHTKVNPISRITSTERLITILKHQKRFLELVIEGGRKLKNTYQDGIENTFLHFGIQIDKENAEEKRND